MSNENIEFINQKKFKYNMFRQDLQYFQDLKILDKRFQSLKFESR